MPEMRVPYAKAQDWVLYQGHVLDVLRAMPPESVHCVVTSPPYYVLRDYGLPPTIWGGDPGCAHEWGPPIQGPEGYSQGQRRRWQHGITRDTDPAAWQRRTRLGQFCKRCGAWRGSLGLEPTPELYVAHLVEVFREMRRVLRRDGVVWLNLDDTYAASRSYQVPDAARRETSHHMPILMADGTKPKDLIGIPWRVALALQADGWYLRADVILSRPNPMPESVEDRPTRSHEYLFLLTKSARYYYDSYAIREPAVARNLHDYTGTGYAAPGQPPHTGNRPASTRGLAVHGLTRNRRTVWTIRAEPFPEPHFATFPKDLVRLCVLSGTSPKACPRCGAPWRRVIRKGIPVLRESSGQGVLQFDQQANAESGSAPTYAVQVETVGWEPTCRCEGNDGSGKSVVLDPFVGSGTTVLVAVALGRMGVGIELSETYCAMAARRLHRVQAPLPVVSG